MNAANFFDKVNFIFSRLRSASVTVVIEVQRAGAAGGTPGIPVKSIIRGFDWDDNKIIITPEKPLRETDADEMTKLRKEASDLGWSVYEFGNLKRENARLRKEIGQLRQQLNLLGGNE